MRVVVASVHDAAARGLVARWRASGEEAGVLTCVDLSSAGWRHAPLDEGAGRAVVDGRVVATREISAVVTRMHVVTHGELAHITAADRDYAASEMQAFLLAWLASLRCPVINRPVPGSLSGPCWSREVWRERARRAGVPVGARVRRAGTGAPRETPPAPGELTAIDIVGRRSFHVAGVADPDAGRHALAVAAAADVELLRVVFAREPELAFLEAGPWVDLSNEAVACALTELLAPDRIAPLPLATSTPAEVAVA